MAAAIPSAFLLLLYSPFLVSSEISPSPALSREQGLGSALSIAVPPSSHPPISPSPVDDVSPPAPPLEVHSHASEPSPSPSPSPFASPFPSTTPSPSSVAADVRHSEDVDADNRSQKESSGGGMSAGRKAGVAIGVAAAAAVVGLAVVVYRKRQENVRRARYGYNARMMEMI